MGIARLQLALEAALEEQRPQARSLVASVFGDVVEPHGGGVWLRVLIDWLAPFGIPERNTRTAVTRLVNEGWLARTTHGRQSELRLGEVGAHRTREAERRIYGSAPPPWKGGWSLLLIGPCELPTPGRDRLRRELRLLGFGEWSPEVFAHPAADIDELAHLLRSEGLRDAIVLAAGDHPGWPCENDTRGLAQLVARSFDFAELSERYATFVDRFTPIVEALGERPAPAQAFLARVLAVHEYRPVVLRDPQLPADLLPDSWDGHSARALVSELYQRTLGPAGVFVRSTGSASHGRFRAAEPGFRRRFRQSGPARPLTPRRNDA